MRHTSFNVEYTFRGIHVRPFRIITVFLVLLALVSHVIMMAPALQMTIVGVMRYMSFTLYWILLIIYVGTLLNEDTQMVYSSIEAVDKKISAELNQNGDWFLLSMATLKILLVITMFVLSLLRGFELFDCLYFTMIPVRFDLISVAMMKQMIVKRLRYIRSEEELMERIEDTISISRLLLELNFKLTETYGWLANVVAIYTLQTLLFYLYAVWAVYGAGLKLPQIYTNQLIPTIGFFIMTIIVIILIAAVTSRLSDEVIIILVFYLEILFNKYW